MRQKYALCRVDRVDYPKMRTVRVPEGKTLENGTIVKLGTLEGRPGAGEVYAAETLTNNKGDVYALVNHDGHQYDDRYDERDFIAEEGDLVRVYRLNPGEIYTIAKTMVTGDVAKDDILEPIVGGYKLQKCADVAASTNLIAKVIEVETWAGQESLVIETI